MSESKAAPGYRGVGILPCTALVVANMIGTGVFTSLGFQVAALPSGFAVLLLWVLGGVLALCGALSYAELALAIPRSGGEYHFLGRIYHPAAGCVAGMVSIFAGFAGPTAAAAKALERYMGEANGGAIPLPTGTLAVTAVLLAALPHWMGVKYGSVFQVAFTSLKFGLVLAFLAAGMMMGDPQPMRLVPAPEDWKLVTGTAFAVSLMYVMYSYSGWNAVVYILGEVRDRRRTVLTSILTGTSLVAVVYVLLNWVFLRAAPMEALAGKVEVGAVAAEFLFGGNGPRIMAGLVGLGLISVISALMWLGPRVIHTMGEDLPALRWFAKHSERGVPAGAIGFQVALVLTFVVVGRFDWIVMYTQFTLTLCSFLVVLGVIVLRVREPKLERPFRVPWYPLPPVLYLAIAGFTMVFSFREYPIQSFLGLATLAAGAGLYYVSGRRVGKS